MILNRVLMKANPNFFNLSKEDQEDYRLNFANEADENTEIYDRIIGKELFGKELEADDFDNFNNKEYYKYNMKKCELLGFGNDNLIVNEFFMIDRKLKEMPNVADYDLAFEKDQIKLELENLEEGGHSFTTKEELEAKEYSFSLRTIWLNMIIDDSLYYTTLISAKSYISDLLTTELTDCTDLHYPNEIVDVEPNEDSFLGNLGMGIDANGKEDFLDELKRMSYSSLRQICDKMGEELKKENINGTIIKDKSLCKDENNITFIVINEETARKLNWFTLYEDVKTNEVEFSVLDIIVNKYKLKIKEMVEDNYKHIEKNFDPDKVVPIKKRKVIILDSAMKDLEKIAENLIKDEDADTD